MLAGLLVSASVMLSQAQSTYELTVSRTKLVQQVAEMALLEAQAEQADGEDVMGEAIQRRADNRASRPSPPTRHAVPGRGDVHPRARNDRP